MARLSSTVPRGAAAIAALAVVAWFSVSARQAHDTTRATDILQPGSTISRAQARTVGALLRTAGQLNPDATVDMLRAQLLVERGKPRQATAILLRVVHGEPMNATAWSQLARTTTDRTTYVQSLVALGSLAPPHLKGP